MTVKKSGGGKQRKTPPPNYLEPLIAVKKPLCRRHNEHRIDRTSDRLALANRMAVKVPRYTERGNRRALILVLCRRRTV